MNMNEKQITTSIAGKSIHSINYFFIFNLRKDIIMWRNK